METLTLPSDTNGRAAAELHRLQARLDDATAAAANGNGDAVTAALDAYRQTLAGASAAAGADPTREEPLVAELGRHQAVLGALAGRVPPTAAAAIQQAVQRTQDKINAIIEAPSQPGRAANPGQPSGTPKPGQPGGAANPGSAGHSPDPGHPTNPSDPGKTPPAH